MEYNPLYMLRQPLSEKVTPKTLGLLENYVFGNLDISQITKKTYVEMPGDHHVKFNALICVVFKSFAKKPGNRPAAMKDAYRFLIKTQPGLQKIQDNVRAANQAAEDSSEDEEEETHILVKPRAPVQRSNLERKPAVRRREARSPVGREYVFTEWYEDQVAQLREKVEAAESACGSIACGLKKMEREVEASAQLVSEYRSAVDALVQKKCEGYKINQKDIVGLDKALKVAKHATSGLLPFGSWFDSNESNVLISMASVIEPSLDEFADFCNELKKHRYISASYLETCKPINEAETNEWFWYLVCHVPYDKWVQVAHVMFKTMPHAFCQVMIQMYTFPKK